MTLRARVATTRETLDELTQLLQATQIDYSPSTDELKERLVTYYSVVNPERLPSIDAVLEKYGGKEASLFAALDSKYDGLIADDNARATAENASELDAAQRAIEAEAERDSASAVEAARAFAAQREAAARTRYERAAVVESARVIACARAAACARAGYLTTPIETPPLGVNN